MAARPNAAPRADDAAEAACAMFINFMTRLGSPASAASDESSRKVLRPSPSGVVPMAPSGKTREEASTLMAPRRFAATPVPAAAAFPPPPPPPIAAVRPASSSAWRFSPSSSSAPPPAKA